MSHPLAEHLYAATPGGAQQTQPVYERVLAEQFSANDDTRKVHEKWFRDAVAANPILVMEPCRAADRTEDQWDRWAVEHPVADADGRSGCNSVSGSRARWPAPLDSRPARKAGS